MAFITLIRKLVGDPITKEWTDKVKDNLDDLDQRLNQNETVGGAITIFNGDIQLEGAENYDPYVFHYKATQNFSPADVRVQLFEKGGISSGILSVDVQKGDSTDPDSFNTTLSGEVAFDFSDVGTVDYLEKVGSVDSEAADFSPGDVLRLSIESIPSGYTGKILVSIGAE